LESNILEILMQTDRILKMGNLRRRFIFGFLLLLVAGVFMPSAFAPWPASLAAERQGGQDEGVQSAVNYKVHKMQTELSLTQAQADAVGPIIKDYMIRREAVLQEAAGQGIVDHVAVKGTLKGLKENEYQKLSKILSEDQMKKWINKENVMAALNPDSAESTVDEGPSLTASGANFKF